MINIVSLQYRYDFPDSFKAYQQKISHLVGEYASEGANLLIFPEYAGLEMLSFAPIEKLPDYFNSYIDLFQDLSHRHNIHICSGSHLVATDEGSFNRSYLFAPNKMSYQDKCILTPAEVNEGIASRGNKLRLFETELGKVGICICYDIEFPSLVKQVAEAGAQLILVPSYTASVHGFYRVSLSCRARALENQCYVVQSALVGQTDIEIAYGSSAIYSPIDAGFPEDGILAMGTRDQQEAVKAQIDFSKLEKVRTEGQTHNFSDAISLNQRSFSLELLDLR